MKIFSNLLEKEEEDFFVLDFDVIISMGFPNFIRLEISIDFSSIFI